MSPGRGLQLDRGSVMLPSHRMATSRRPQKSASSPLVATGTPWGLLERCRSAVGFWRGPHGRQGRRQVLSMLGTSAGRSPRKQGAVALTVRSVPRRIVPEWRHFHWFLKINNQSNWRNSKTVLYVGPILLLVQRLLRRYCTTLRSYCAMVAV